MADLKKLREQYQTKHEALTVLARMVQEGKELTEEQQTEFDGGTDELAEMKRSIERAEKAQSLLAAAGMPVGTETSESDKDEKEMKRFSLRRAALRAGIESGYFAKDLTHEDLGYEKEMHQEFEKEAAQTNIKRSGQAEAGIPRRIVRSLAIMALAAEGVGGMQRAMSVTGDTGTKGGKTVDTELDTNIIRLFKNMSVYKSLGARIKTGLSSDYSILKEGSHTTAGWLAEGIGGSPSDKTFNTVSLSPERLFASTVRSRRLLIQSSIDIDAELTADLFNATDQELNSTVFVGLGSSNQPLGILSNTDITQLELGADEDTGGALTYEKVVNMMTKIDVDNALEGNLAFVSNSKVRGSLMTTKKDAGSGLFVMPDKGSLIGYPYVNTNVIPSNIVKGESEAVLSALIFGNFADLEISGWGGMSLIVNPYSLDLQDQARITINTYWNMLVRRAKSFVVYKDIVTSL